MNLSVAYHCADIADSNNHRHCATSVMSSASHSGPKCYRLLTLIGIVIMMMMMMMMMKIIELIFLAS